MGGRCLRCRGDLPDWKLTLRRSEITIGQYESMWESVRIFGVVKGDAYNLGADKIGRVLADMG